MLLGLGGGGQIQGERLLHSVKMFFLSVNDSDESMASISIPSPPKKEASLHSETNISEDSNSPISKMLPLFSSLFVSSEP